MARLIIGLFLIAHGLIHVLYGTPHPADAGSKWPFELSRSWLLNGLGLSEGLTRGVGTLLWIGAALFFVLAGLGIFGIIVPHEWWRLLAVVGAGFGFLLLTLYWHPWLVVGVALNAVVFVMLVWAQWPSEETISA